MGFGIDEELYREMSGKMSAWWHPFSAEWEVVRNALGRGN